MKWIIPLALMLSLVLCACAPTEQAAPATSPAQSQTQGVVVADVPAPTRAPTRVQAPTEVVVMSQPTPTITPSPTPGPVRTRPADGMAMVYVPEGPFLMGEDADRALSDCSMHYVNCQVLPDTWKQESPRHTVTLDAFWIDRTEVTNAMYGRCVRAGACPPLDGFWPTPVPDSYYDDPRYANLPVIEIEWDRADVYCAWAGARLPTEAEWEKAARGTDGRIWPWGSDPPPRDDLLSFGLAHKGPSEVGSYPAGASPYGALDMAGNVSEWVADWYAADYYATSPADNPQGPQDGWGRVVRGSSWYSDWVELPTYYRSGTGATSTTNGRGFRCASSAP